MNTSYDTTFKDLPEGKAAMAEMSGSGDTKYTWDPDSPDEVEAAREHFDAMRAKGFLVFKLKAWIKTKRLTKFDPKVNRLAYVASKKMKTAAKKTAVKEAEAQEVEAQMATEFDPNAMRYVAVPPLSGG
jgi:hypothetical protein